MKIITTTIVALLLVISSSIAFAAARSWDMDKAHSGIYFSVDHIFSKVRGHFNEFTLEVNFDPAQLDESSFAFTIEVGSIDTNITKRDKHLLSADFFDSGKFPQMSFVSSKITDAGNGLYNVTGTLTVKDKPYELTLPLKLEGVKEHPAKKGTEVAGFNGTVVIDRLAHGVGGGKFYDMGIVGKEVEIFVTLEVLSNK
jgi:polyisoprenoid-binding protein YceI